MKKLVFVIGQLSNGGAERVVSVLANSLSNKYIVTIITLIDSRIEYQIDPQIKVIHIESKTNNKICRVINRFAGLRKKISEINPDIIISFTTEINIYSIFSVIGKRVPLIISERNDPYNDPPSTFTRKIRNMVYRWASGYVFQTEDAKNYFSKLIKGPQVVIPNPICTNLPDARKCDKSHKIVTVSRLYEQKNIPMLLNAFKEVYKKYPYYQLEIYGEGPLRSELEKLSRDLGIKDNVSFMGFCKDVHEHIKNAEVFVLTSNYEGMSNAMLEALAMGLPTICTDCPIGGARTIIVNHKNGVLIPVNNTDMLVSELIALISDIGKRESLSNFGFNLRDQLSVESITKKWIDVIEQIEK